MTKIPSRAVPEKPDPKAPAEDLATLPRKISECLSFQPWWRNLLVSSYLSQHQAAEASRSIWSPPASETDFLVNQYFSFRAYSHASEEKLTRALRWCHRAHYITVASGSKIRAMVVAGMTDAEIAPFFATTADNIAVYVALFFDIRECLPLEMWMDSFIRPGTGTTAAAAADSQESMEMAWMLVAYHMGRTQLMHVMAGRIAFLPEEEQKEFWQLARGLLTTQAFMHMVDVSISSPAGRATDLERSLRLLESESRLTGGGGNFGGGNKLPTRGGTNVAEWLLEAGNERRIFDPGVWFEVTHPGRPPVIELSQRPDGSFVPDAVPEITPPERNRRISALFG